MNLSPKKSVKTEKKCGDNRPQSEWVFLFWKLKLESREEVGLGFKPGGNLSKNFYLFSCSHCQQFHKNLI